MATLRYLDQAITLRVDSALCSGCGLCLEVCPHEVLALDQGRRVQVVQRELCMECGACQTNCPSGALSVEKGVGCAAAVINSALGISGACCCSLEPANKPR